MFAVQGDADVRRKAVADLSARALQGMTALLLALDSRPDDNRFDVDVTVNAALGGLLATLAGLRQDANLRLQGKGDWTRWTGAVAGDAGPSLGSGVRHRAAARQGRVRGYGDGLRGG